MIPKVPFCKTGIRFDLSKTSAETKENNSEREITCTIPIFIKFEVLVSAIPIMETDKSTDTIA
jgi:hypothetical protein